MNGTQLKAGFEKDLVNLRLEQILPLKTIKSNLKASQKYKRILSSVEEVGIIEPLVVCPQNGDRGDGAIYHLLDGHLRYEVLKELGREDTICLISTDDEMYTYNRHVNRLSIIQEHMMIMKALKEGVDEQRLAKALSLDLNALREKQAVIKGICEEAVDLLKEKHITPNALRLYKKVLPLRQIEMAELMVAADNYSLAYAKALYLASSHDMLVEADKEKVGEHLKPEDLSRMERDMQGLEKDFKLLEDSYAHNVLKLVLARGYLKKILENARVMRFLSLNYQEIFGELQKIVEASSLDS